VVVAAWVFGGAGVAELPPEHAVRATPIASRAGRCRACAHVRRLMAAR
jgi:hypothetical protein